MDLLLTTSALVTGRALGYLREIANISRFHVAISVADSVPDNHTNYLEFLVIRVPEETEFTVGHSTQNTQTIINSAKVTQIGPTGNRTLDLLIRLLP